MSASAASQPGSARFGKSRRLLRAAEYRAVFDGASVKVSHRHLLLLARPASGPVSRLGLVIAKKNVRKAVQRNRIKRVAREHFRRLPTTATPLDVILLARRGLDELDNSALFAVLADQWHKLAPGPKTPTQSRNP